MSRQRHKIVLVWGWMWIDSTSLANKPTTPTTCTRKHKSNNISLFIGQKSVYSETCQRVKWRIKSRNITMSNNNTYHHPHRTLNRLKLPDLIVNLIMFLDKHMIWLKMLCLEVNKTETKVLVNRCLLWTHLTMIIVTISNTTTLEYLIEQVNGLLIVSLIKPNIAYGLFVGELCTLIYSYASVYMT